MAILGSINLFIPTPLGYSPATGSVATSCITTVGGPLNLWYPCISKTLMRLSVFDFAAALCEIN